MKSQKNSFYYRFKMTLFWTIILSCQNNSFADEIFRCDGTYKQDQKIGERMQIAIRIHPYGATVTGETGIFTGVDSARLFLEKERENIDQIAYCAGSCGKGGFLSATFDKNLSVLFFKFINPNVPAANWTASFNCHAKIEEKFEPLNKNKPVKWLDLLALALNFFGCIILLFFPPKVKNISNEG